MKEPLDGKTPALQGTGQLSENRNDSAYHHRKVDNSSVSSTVIMFSTSFGLQNKLTVEPFKNN